jgi:uncharacterized phage protein (TIGR02220 family)
MPQRFLRPGIRTSPRWNAVSHECHTLYIAILTLVDDHGRYDGRPCVLWAEAFAVWNDQNPQAAITPQQTAAMCQQLAAVDLVEFYEFGGRTYLQLTQWEERRRNKSRWPNPPPNNNRLPMAADGCRWLPADVNRLPSSPVPSPVPSPSPSNGYMSDSASPKSDVSPKKRRGESCVLIKHLNEKAGRNYRETEQNIKLICARLHEVGGDVDGCKLMISRQCELWKSSQKMAEFLRPETLFGKEKFGTYYDNRDLPILNGHSPEQTQLKETITVKSL